VLYIDRRPAAGWRRERRGEVCRAGLMEVHHLDGDTSIDTPIAKSEGFLVH
jgi:hypothetical protein